MLRPSRSMPITLLRGLAGSIAGAVIGYLVFGWARDLFRGAVFLVLPGALVGIGCGMATGRRSLAAGVLAGVVALVISVIIKWKFFPFADDSLVYTLRYLHESSRILLLMIAAGTLAGFWFGWHRSLPERPEKAA